METIDYEECLLSSDDDSVDFPRATSLSQGTPRSTLISKDNTPGPGHSNGKNYSEPRCFSKELAFTETHFDGYSEGPSLISSSDNYSPQKSKLLSRDVSSQKCKNVVIGVNPDTTHCIKNSNCVESVLSNFSVFAHHQHMKVYQNLNRKTHNAKYHDYDLHNISNLTCYNS